MSFTDSTKKRNPVLYRQLAAIKAIKAISCTIIKLKVVKCCRNDLQFTELTVPGDKGIYGNEKVD